MAKNELNKLREQIKEQRALLRRAQRWLGVAGGTYAAALTAVGKEHFSYALRDAATAPIELASEISEYLEQFD